MSEQRDETDTMVGINPPSTSNVTAVITHPLPASPERSTGLAPSYSQLAMGLKLNPAGIRTDNFTDVKPERKRRPKAKVVSGKSVSGNTFKGGPTTRNMFCSVPTVMLARILVEWLQTTQPTSGGAVTADTS